MRSMSNDQIPNDAPTLTLPEQSVFIARVFVLFVAAILTGCWEAAGGGVFRDARLEAAIDTGCVVAAFQQTSAIGKVEFSPWGGGMVGSSNVSVLRLLQPGEFSAAYTAGDVRGVQLDIRIDAGSGFEFRHYFGAGINFLPRQQDIDFVRPVMEQLERSIEKACGIMGFAASVHEECVRVACPPLSGLAL